ncbi:hypothetical protein ACQKWADRAFT_327029 [Trichoderma austrokoningii]
MGLGNCSPGDTEWTSTVTESEAQERADLAILPSDDKWNETYRMFADLFADENTSIGEILASKFTQHEISLFMLSASKILKAIQDDNTERFHTLLRTRLRDVAPEMITKLIMLYFGLPIEPIDFSLTDMTYKMEIREPASPQSVGDPPLGFLTAHKERNWGDENFIGREDQSHPIPTQLPQKLLSSLLTAPLRKGINEQENENTMLCLRGGESNEDSDWEKPGGDSDWDGDDDGDLSYAASSNEDSSDDVDEKEAKEKKSKRRQTGKGSDKVGSDKANDNGVDNGEARDSEASRAECDEDSALALLDSKRQTFIKLYGFQGFVSFALGDQSSYEDAIRRLLSLGPQDSAKLHLIHYYKDCSLADIIPDSYPLDSNSASLYYISKQDLTLQPSFFVELENEDVPDHWEPSEPQLTCEVSRVIWSHNAGISLEPTGPISCCYMQSPEPENQPSSTIYECNWDFDQYNAYTGAAFEVLLGPSLDPFRHALFHMYGPCINYSTFPEYGIPAVKNSEIKKGWRFRGERTLELKCTKLDNRNETVFLLPSYYSDARRLVRLRRDDYNASEVVGAIRDMMLYAFGSKDAEDLSSVRLLHGRATFGPETSRNQKTYSIKLKGDSAEDCDTHNAAVISEFFADGGVFALLYPEWDEDSTSLSINGSGGFEVDTCVQIPPLCSTVEQFRDKVFELMKVAGHQERQIMRVKNGKSFISIRPLPQAGGNENAPCFFIGPNTTNEEWFKIRARISTPEAGIRINDSKKWNWDWRARGQKTSIWGPRYGRIAETEAMKQQNKVTWAERAEVIQGTAVSESSRSNRTSSSAGNDEPMQASHLDCIQLLRRKKKEAHDREKRRTAYTTQPSNFNRHGLVPWPANSGIQIPTSVPPAEHMPRMPLVSKAILTPTEQRELQKITWDLRNLCLNRTVRCPYDGCNFSYTLKDEAPMKKHLKAYHTARKCMWCDETLYEHWDAARINYHVREKHRDELMQALGVSKAVIRRFGQEGTVSIPLRRAKKLHIRSALALASASKHAVCEAEVSPESQNDKALGFCDRCGRTGNYYNRIEQAHHDSNCEPGIFNGANCKFCTICSKPVWPSATEAQKSGKSDGQLSHCSHIVDDKNGPHCSRCGFNTSRLPQDGREQHQKRCKGFGALSGRFCLYCGEEFRNAETQAHWNRNKDHMIACFQKNSGAVGGLEEPETAAFNQQQNNLRLQIAISAAVVSEEDQGQNGKDGDMDDNGEEPGQIEPGQIEPAKETEATNSPAQDIDMEMQKSVQETASSRKNSQPPIPDRDSGRYSQEALRIILRRSISGEPPLRLSTEALGSILQQKPLRTSPIQQASRVSASDQNEKEAEFETGAESPLFVETPPSSDAGSDTGSLFGEDSDQDAQPSDAESEDELLSDPSRPKRRKPRGRRRMRQGDANYRAESEDDDDDDSEVDEEGRRSRRLRRARSPDWNKVLGSEDPDFVPSDEYYCSKCFRKAPKNHKRERSPLGRRTEIELHHDPVRCCRIRRGIGSTNRLPNRSGWIPADLMPKPISILRERSLKKHPEYRYTFYPLNPANANGSYWRSDPNNECNAAYWTIPWPPYKGPAPFPNGWEAPDVVDHFPIAGKARQQFQLKPVADPTYRQGKNDVQYSDDEDVDDTESDKDTNGKRKRKGKATAAAKKVQKTAGHAEAAAAAPRPVKRKRAPQAAKSQADSLYIEEEEAITRRLTRKRRRTVNE